MRNFKISLLLFPVILIIISTVNAQECQLLQSFADGSHKVKIGMETYRAISEEQMRKLLKLEIDLQTAQKENVLKDSLLASYKKNTYWYDTVLQQKNEYIQEIESVMEGYKKLVRDYKRLREPWLTFEAGLGATSADYKPAILTGLSIRRIRAWGMIQERNSGVLIGTSFRLF